MGVDKGELKIFVCNLKSQLKHVVLFDVGGKYAFLNMYA